MEEKLFTADLIEDVTVQILDRKVGNTFISKEIFSKTLADWNGVPIVFQREGKYPARIDLVDTDLEEIGGKVVGKVNNARINVTGAYPKFDVTLDITEMYAEISELYDRGKMMVSPVFSAWANGAELTSASVPKYVLMFESTEDQ
ncbi:hypothetical protein EOM86_14300 [Candidatus Nomurabacteria bacterium]|nr:hypothetical protein [Candidatus Nomurabacteria bacterium]